MKLFRYISIQFSFYETPFYDPNETVKVLPFTCYISEDTNLSNVNKNMFKLVQKFILNHIIEQSSTLALPN